MSIQKYSSIGRFKVAGTSEIVPVACVVFPDNQQIAQMVLTLYKLGTAGGNETLRVNMYADLALTKLISRGEAYALSEITGNSTSWLGRVGFTINNRPWVKSGSTYYFGIEIENYTRNLDAFYLAFLMIGSVIKHSFIGLREESLEK